MTIRKLSPMLLVFLFAFLAACGGNSTAPFVQPLQASAAHRIASASTQCNEPQTGATSANRVSSPDDCTCVPENGNDCSGSDGPDAPGDCEQNGTCAPCGGDVCVSSKSGNTIDCDPVTCGAGGYVNPPHGGVGVPKSRHTPAPYQKASIFWALVQAKVPYKIITSAAANQVVADKYGNPAAEESFGGIQAFQIAWQTAYNTILNGSKTPSLQTLASNLNTLVRFSATAAGAQTGSWWTAIGSVVDETGTLLPPSQIQSVLALAATPQFMAIGGQIPAGSTVIYGQAASNAFGPGGAWQILTEEAGQALGEVVQIAGESGLAHHRAGDFGFRVVPISTVDYPL